MRHRLAAIAAAVVLCLVGGGTASAVHPGAPGGLAWPIADGIRVEGREGGPYELPIADAADVAWSPGGRYLAYTVPGGDAPGLYVTDSAGCLTDRLTDDGQDRAPSFNGHQLLFTRGDATWSFEASVIDDEWSRDPTPTQETGVGTDLTWSVLEGQIAHVEPPNDSHPGDYALVVDAIFASSTTTVFSSEDPILDTEWNADGSLLAFSATDAGGSYQVHVAEFPDGDEPVIVTESAGDARHPSFSPDGTELAHLDWAPSATTADVRLIQLGASGSALIGSGAIGGLDWQSPLTDPPPTAPRPIETTTTVQLVHPPAVPGQNAVRISVSPAPPSGQVKVSVGSTQVGPLSLGPDGTVTTILTLKDGDVVVAGFGGVCPYRASSGSLSVKIPPPPPPPGQPFTDINGSKFKNDIIWAWQNGITVGCSPTLYCPDGLVTRGQMATFLARALHLPAATKDFFTDDAGSTHENNINRVAQAGITVGCGPTTFCPNGLVTRAQMATFLARGYHLPATTTDFFTDDTGSVHENNINRVAAAGITSGCAPNQFCPNGIVTRGQMAAFLHRASLLP